LEDQGVIQVKAEFERNSIVDVTCEGVQNNQSGEVSSVCKCTREDGTSNVCNASEGECCFLERLDRKDVVSVVLEIRATRCAEQCAFTSPELSMYCSELR